MATLPTPPSMPLDTFLDLALSPSTNHYTLYPIFQTLDADLDTPISVYLKLTSPHSAAPSFLLESVQRGEYQHRFSYIGTNPSHLLTQNHCDPLVQLQQQMAQYKPYPTPALPDFNGGAIGYVSYDCVGYWEKKVPVPERNELGIAQSCFMFCPSLVIFDHVKQSIHAVSHVEVQPDDRAKGRDWLVQKYNKAVERLSTLLEQLSTPLPVRATPRNPNSSLSSPTASDGSLLSPTSPTATASSASTASTPSSHSSSHHHGMQSNVGADGYKRMVNALKDHIVRGNIIQAVPSQRLSRPLKEGVSAFDIYRSLRVINPSPYMFYVDWGGWQIVGASPEQLVKIEGKGGRVTTHPIAGTRRRGKTREEDEQLEKELLSSEKERAEHIMLVDLGRNDIGKICTPGSVQVESLMHIERYSHVMHIVSVVSGILAPQHTAYDAFRSVFPAGTVSGAPKIRAMQLIAELEREQRGVYAGAVGFVSYSGTLDVAIAIRTLIVKDGVAYLQAGAGIVYDSEPAAEEKETVKKMMALVHAIEKAEATAAYQQKQKELALRVDENGIRE